MGRGVHAERDERLGARGAEPVPDVCRHDERYAGVHLRETLAALQPGLAFAVEDRDRLHVWVGVERGPVSWLRGLHADTDWRRTGAVANEGLICRGTLHGLRRDLGMTDGGHHPLPSARSVISRLAAIR